jgi:hypothetical protein
VYRVAYIISFSQTDGKPQGSFKFPRLECAGINTLSSAFFDEMLQEEFLFRDGSGIVKQDVH